VSGPEIRPFRAEDLDAVIAGITSEEPDAHRRRLEDHERGDAVWVVAWVDGTPAGYGGLWLEELDESRGLPLVDYLVVEEPHRRRGIGRALMLALEDRAREAGAPGVMLDTGIGPDSAPARALYRSLGYLERSGVYLGGWSDPDRPRVHLVEEMMMWVKPLR
jgi:GNAT superfamily N-acetyltransferase